ncbi:hypothetical protein A6M27_17075 [Acidithiobacillus thiooxidans]|uniref:Rad52/Rad22 family DNA repair protein n=1 Tax=Acidithiobacillus thiooxidans TaxID=930 RepID=UPI0004AC73A7|nr:Rad52/Rad22 family DNA repair protein [Acidithiobacillus thiooxidans]OCX68475.1 hypothetical protein A6O24_19665 [Acidithiobacillus thiooxidans]OCX83463.1 hypothetical protein A6O26_06965 [Acidithiobacillus thiooxidans]OCX83807.1 hypothetical protein A6M27_17075 [Acidithiobacillus thiooxidans]OFC50293.1 hypothetical protein BAE47_03060 [Acidithiobacillus thiooxidans]
MAVAKKEPVKENISGEAVQPEVSIWDRLAAPFPRSEIQGRVQGKPGRTGKAQVVAYIDARTVMKRLDDVIGPQNWKDEVRLMEGGAGFISRISLRIPDSGEWIYREDVADLSSIEALKGGASDAFKRAAVKLGIGRYLYDLPTVWVDLNGSNYLPRGFVYPLPDWAVAEGDTSVIPASGETASAEDQPVWGGASGSAPNKNASASEDLL